MLCQLHRFDFISESREKYHSCNPALSRDLFYRGNENFEISERASLLIFLSLMFSAMNFYVTAEFLFMRRKAKHVRITFIFDVDYELLRKRAPNLRLKMQSEPPSGPKGCGPIRRKRREKKTSRSVGIVIAKFSAMNEERI